MGPDDKTEPMYVGETFRSIDAFGFKASGESKCPLPFAPICIAAGKRTLFSAKSGRLERERNSCD